ncbi:hypothetical protein F5Y01DRAFT_6832 [Xylaria sp. FL0043]|nr:hypothetical protein F5Y01DRAFT_6832 [Xylaria sp. FL0043]
MKIEWTKLAIFLYSSVSVLHLPHAVVYIHRCAGVLLKMVPPPTSCVLVDFSAYIACRLKSTTVVVYRRNRLSGVAACTGEEVLRSCARYWNHDLQLRTWPNRLTAPLSCRYPGNRFTQALLLEFLEREPS